MLFSTIPLRIYLKLSLLSSEMPVILFLLIKCFPFKPISQIPHDNQRWKGFKSLLTLVSILFPPLHSSF